MKKMDKIFSKSPSNCNRRPTSCPLLVSSELRKASQNHSQFYSQRLCEVDRNKDRRTNCENIAGLLDQENGEPSMSEFTSADFAKDTTAKGASWRMEMLTTGIKRVDEHCDNKHATLVKIPNQTRRVAATWSRSPRPIPNTSHRQDERYVLC
ncbi:hypothetical protein RB213_001651 [Colletotrichum asianum]